ncbi:isopentenyl-diphosphate Delta-isomerase 1-like [Dreissena polymorpha]|uniref:isopentenyl-diphosphate Delta-isomerase n=1 Tax=Dreissena polymorpha TaxID=45954 RepID=A0A9D4KGU3_DREPO|nr:isopentenyl-diphosphate Delta-isomerase 1-like [Dreissena polymorpha]KAH3839290.1 hypothetical protein DPMN_112716 [Dreissena polymorpha]
MFPRHIYGGISRLVCGKNKLKSSKKYSNGTSPIQRSDSQVDSVLQKYDTQQRKYLKEPCILVDSADHVIGSASKKDCHLLTNISQGMLHRAFSVFLFNNKTELLLQQRADTKITFPGMFTNTCCSHPLSTTLELEERNALGVRRAAQRKLFHELGIPPDQIPLDKIKYITRIQYSARNIPNDGIFAENEIDYVLFVLREVTLNINQNEVKTYQYVSQAQLKDMIAQADLGQVALTPWFRLICKNFLFDWWANLHKMETIKDHKNIHFLS